MTGYFKKYLTVVIILAVIILILYRFPVLMLQEVNTGKIIFINPAKINSQFTMKWMHSVELQPWEENFIIDKNLNILLSSTRFKSFGAGVPESAGTKTELKDGYVVFSGINKKMPQLIYGISNYAKHTFYYDDMEIKLYEIVENGNSIKIFTSYISYLKYLTISIPLHFKRAF